MSEERVEVELTGAPPAPPHVKRGRGRPRAVAVDTPPKSRARDWRGESAYQRWLVDPPAHQAQQSADVNRLLAAIRARAKEAGFEHRQGVAWTALAKEAGLKQLQLELMLRGRQRMPLHILVMIAAAVGLRVTVVEDDRSLAAD